MILEFSFSTPENYSKRVCKSTNKIILALMRFVSKELLYFMVLKSLEFPVSIRLLFKNIVILFKYENVFSHFSCSNIVEMIVH